MIFVSRELPTRESIVSVLSVEIFGVFKVEKSSLTVGELRQIDVADKPSPSELIVSTPVYKTHDRT